MSRIAKNKKPLSIYSRLKEKVPDPMPVPILKFGSKVGHSLYTHAAYIQNHRLGRVRAGMESLKLSAARAGSYSLSAPQLNLSMQMIAVHKDL